MNRSLITLVIIVAITSFSTNSAPLLRGVLKKIYWYHVVSQLPRQKQKRGWLLTDLIESMQQAKEILPGQYNPSFCWDLLFASPAKQKQLQNQLGQLLSLYNQSRYNDVQEQILTFAYAHKVKDDDIVVVRSLKNKVQKKALIHIPFSYVLAATCAGTCGYVLLKRRAPWYSNVHQPDDVSIPINNSPVPKSKVRIVNTVGISDAKKWIDKKIYKGWTYPDIFNVFVNNKKIRKNESVDLPEKSTVTVVYEHEWRKKMFPFARPAVLASGERKIVYTIPKGVQRVEIAFNKWDDSGVHECITTKPPIKPSSSVTTKLYMNSLLQHAGLIS